MSLADPVNQRLLEGAARNLGLEPVLLEQADADAARLIPCEMVVADEPAARELQQRLATYRKRDPQVRPALVAVVNSPEERVRAEQAPSFDGVLLLPEKPGIVAAQLSIILYATRAFSGRYESALDELRLNRQIFQSVTSGITVADATTPDMPLLYVNPGFEVMTGYALEEVLGKNCRFLQNGHSDQPGLKILRDAIANHREAVALLRNFRKDGTPFWNELYLSPTRDHEGRVTHFVGIQMDVTERVEFEAALRSSEKLAAVGRLASTIAHEINNPLEAVVNLIYLAQHTEVSRDIKHYLALADQELRRVKLITSQSLRFYKQSTRPQAVAPAELLGSVVEFYESRLRNANIVLEQRHRPAGPVVCMESEIRQVLNNLISNAVYAMRTTGGCLQLRSHAGTQARTGVRGAVITVADTGSGMPPETLRRIFEAFFTTKEAAGNGLGLWISKDIAERHGGTLRVRSSQRPGHTGTVFELFLPFGSDLV